MIQVAGVTLLVAVLFALSLRRPWTGLVLLLALIPFNGFLLAVVAAWIGLDADARTILGAWHDGLALGVVAASVIVLARRREIPRGPVLTLVGLVLAFGLVGIAVAPFRLTAIYAYRTLYEPIALCAAITILARAHGLPDLVRGRAALAIVGAGVVAALFAIWQVYLGGVGFLNLYYRTSDGRLPAAYFSSLIAQPRALGTFNSPNEFGAYMVLAMTLVVVGGILAGSRRARAWAFVGLALGLLLTFSRSAWLGALIAVALGVVLSQPGLVHTRAWIRRFDRSSLILDLGIPVAALLMCTGLVLGSSGGASFLTATIQGRDPSSASRVETIANAIQGLIDPSPTPSSTPSSGSSPTGSSVPRLQTRVSPLGMGLGMAGPKSARFGQIGALAIVSSETWYVNYILQAGIVGSLLLVALLVAIGWRLWRARKHPWPVAAIAAGAGLAVGALAIPVVDEPAVAIPLWSMLGIALVTAFELDRPASSDRSD